MLQKETNSKLMHQYIQKVLKGITVLFLFTLVSCNQDYVYIQFDSEMEVSGEKFLLEEISPGLPADWDGYEYVVLEFMISTPQRFHVGFTTETGYNELRVMSYTPGGCDRPALSSSGGSCLGNRRKNLQDPFRRAGPCG